MTFDEIIPLKKYVIAGYRGYWVIIRKDARSMKVMGIRTDLSLGDKRKPRLKKIFKPSDVIEEYIEKPKYLK